MTAKLQEIIASLKSKSEMRFLPGVTQKRIEAFEKNNGLLLTNQYREWLQFSDGGELFPPAGVQLYGIAHRPVIESDEEIGKQYVVIGSLASGDPIVSVKGTETVAIYNREKNRFEPDEQYDDFVSFLTNFREILGCEA